MKDLYYTMYEWGAEYEDSPYFDPEWEVLTSIAEENEYGNPEYTEFDIMTMDLEDDYYPEYSEFEIMLMELDDD